MKDMINQLENQLELELEEIEITIPELLFGGYDTVTFEEDTETAMFQIESIEHDLYVIDFSAGVEMEGETEFDLDGFQVVSWDLEEIPSMNIETPAPRTFAFDLLRILEREEAAKSRPEAAPALTKTFENLNDPRLGTDSGDWGT